MQKNIETDVLLREKHFGDHEQLPFVKYKEAYNKAGFFHPYPNVRLCVKPFLVLSKLGFSLKIKVFDQNLKF